MKCAKCETELPQEKLTPTIDTHKKPWDCTVWICSKCLGELEEREVMYTVTISGKTMEVQHRYVTGGLLLDWLRSMCPVQDEFVHSNRVRYRYYPVPLGGGLDPISHHDVVDLKAHRDFLLQPIAQ